ncbi:hypothetical protein ES288_A08G248300v1 [Gossypium darwinii]|uniref:F-box domain-containing protein n=1 Tax=Gossypium darwinii TaxID=34276 RepID=A0A5D2FQP7_GOSDA|nr:hypothetical protein ES288_A08G248300v1 [Gossypium darwinii]
MAKCRFSTAEQVVQWCNLPGDVLTIVLSHLFGKDYANLLAVCRSWRSAPPPLRSISNPSASPYPSLFHFSGNNSKCKFYDPFYNDTYVAQIPDELIDARIFFSNYGWLLMCQDTRLFFFHPFTNQRIDLPNIQRHTLEEYGRMCFSTPPTSPNCMVFGILDDSPTVSDVTIIHRGESSWLNIRYKTNNVRFYTSHGNPVFYKGAFYCLGIDGKLGIFDPSKRGRRCWKIIDKLKHPCDSIQENFLVESNGELISICMGHIGEYVRVFRLNYHYEIRWEEVQNLGDEMIFASRTGSMCLRTHSMGNTIYFPNFDNGGNGLFYSLASRKFHSLGVALPRKDLYNTKRMLHCAWITPTALEVYRDDELRWFPNRENFIPSSGRVTVVGAPHTHPSFVLTNLEHSNNQLVFNMFNTPHNAKRILEVRQMRTVKCAFGWLFQVDWGYSDCLLINPQSMEKINLPRLPKIFDKCVISSSPKDPSCIVLLIDYYSFENGSRVDFIYCRPGESEWTIVTVSSSSDESQNSTDSDNEEDEEEEVNSSSDESKNSTDLDYDDDEEEEDDDEEIEPKILTKGRIAHLTGYQGKIYGLIARSNLVKIDFDPIFQVKFVKRGVWVRVKVTLSNLPWNRR